MCQIVTTSGSLFLNFIIFLPCSIFARIVNVNSSHSLIVTIFDSQDCQLDSELNHVVNSPPGSLVYSWLPSSIVGILVNSLFNNLIDNLFRSLFESAFNNLDHNLHDSPVNNLVDSSDDNIADSP